VCEARQDRLSRAPHGRARHQPPQEAWGYDKLAVRYEATVLVAAIKWRFLSAFDLEWNRATRADARDFTRWMQIANKPQRLHWRHRKAGYTAETAPKTVRKKVPGTPNAITGKASPGPQYAARTRAHCETVLRTFYDFHLAEGTGPIINPFPLDRSRGSGRANAHHQPGRPFQRERAGRYRPTIPKRAPRRIPDEMFNALFAALRHHRNRALLAFLGLQ
jgi:hypothetical protein